MGAKLSGGIVGCGGDAPSFLGFKLLVLKALLKQGFLD